MSNDPTYHDCCIALNYFHHNGDREMSISAEEFVYWFGGYVSAIDDRVKVPNEKDWEKILTALRKVQVCQQGIFRIDAT